MPHKELKFNEDARRALERGVNVVADAVRVTLAADRNTLAVASTRVPVVASSAAVLTWESEGGASAERPAG